MCVCVFLLGHAMALMTDDDYLSQPASITAEAIQLYVYSIERYQHARTTVRTYHFSSLYH